MFLSPYVNGIAENPGDRFTQTRAPVYLHPEDTGLQDFENNDLLPARKQVPVTDYANQAPV